MFFMSLFIEHVKHTCSICFKKIHLFSVNYILVSIHTPANTLVKNINSYLVDKANFSNFILFDKT